MLIYYLRYCSSLNATAYAFKAYSLKVLTDICETAATYKRKCLHKSLLTVHADILRGFINLNFLAEFSCV